MTCTFTEDTAACTPRQPLPDDEYDVTATLANTSGNVSMPAELNFTVDTIAPRVDVSSPPDGYLTNQSSLRINGQLSETAALTVNNNGVAIQPDGAFSHGPVTIGEGANTFRFKATDRAGNLSERVLNVTLDTIAPATPGSDRIQAQPRSGGEIAVTGQAGSVEGGTTVTLVNTRTGDRVSVTANADGSFTASITGQTGDEIQILATDAAGNTSQTATITATNGGPFGGPIKFGAISPASGTTVDGDFVLLSIDLQAPPNTGVTLNDLVAAAVPGPSGLRYYAYVPLVTGQNALTITAHAQDGRAVTQTLNINSREPFAYRIAPDRAVGVAPLDAQIEIVDQLGYGIRQIQADFDNNGTVDVITTPGGAPIVAHYTGVGLRRARITVFDDAGAPHTQLVPFVLLDLATVDREVQAVWGGMTGALAAGDKLAAMQFLSLQAREQYEPVFDLLLPKMSEIVATYSTPQRSLVTGTYAEYGVNKPVNGTNRIFLVGFIINEFGQWQVDTM